MNISYRLLLPRRVRSRLSRLVVECGTTNCRSFHLSHPVLARLPGIFLDQTWYCSPGCLYEAVKHRVEAQFGAAITDLHHPPRMPFRLILLAGGRVSEAQLAHARAVQASGAGGEDVGDALILLGYATEEEVAGARASEAGCLFFAGAAQAVQPAYALPLSLSRHYRAMAVHYSPLTARLLIGFVYRIDNALLQAVEQVTGCRVEGCMMTASAWSRQLASRSAAYEELQERASSQSRIVSRIVEQAIESRSDHVRMGLSGAALWARLTGGARDQDLVIDLSAEGVLGKGPVSPGASGNRMHAGRESAAAVPLDQAPARGTVASRRRELLDALRLPLAGARSRARRAAGILSFPDFEPGQTRP